MLQGYLEELRKTSLLEPEEELELWRRDAAGDEAAHQRLMTAYQPGRHGGTAGSGGKL